MAYVLVVDIHTIHFIAITAYAVTVTVSEQLCILLCCYCYWNT